MGHTPVHNVRGIKRVIVALELDSLGGVLGLTDVDDRISEVEFVGYIWNVGE